VFTGKSAGCTAYDGPMNPSGDTSERLSFDAGDVSAVVPVKDNQAGIDRLLRRFARVAVGGGSPGEIIIVDNRSDPPIRLPENLRIAGTQVRLLKCPRPGPGAARNDGVAAAAGKWILFTDSDCVPTETTLTGYRGAPAGAVGYCGLIRPLGRDMLSRYYGQEMLRQSGQQPADPECAVTANALIPKESLRRIGGFDETYTLAATEDVELGTRLTKLGRLAHARESLVLHDFGDGPAGFIRRFVRYGRGNRILSLQTGIGCYSKFFRPQVVTPFNLAAAFVQSLCLKYGYWREGLIRGGLGRPRAATSTPAAGSAWSPAESPGSPGGRPG
jgi:glycosyltransferase involved in cell wall biosynthesis